MDIARMQLENIIILAVCLAIMAYLYYDRKSDERKDCAPPKKSLYLRLSDNLMSLVLILTLCTLVSYKMTKRAVVYMAVPCHVNLTLQIVISLMNSNTKLCRTLSTMMLVSVMS